MFCVGNSEEIYVMRWSDMEVRFFGPFADRNSASQWIDCVCDPSENVPRWEIMHGPVSLIVEDPRAAL